MRQCREFNVIETAYIMYSIKIIIFKYLFLKHARQYWRVGIGRLKIQGSPSMQSGC